MSENRQKEKPIVDYPCVDYYYNPNVECTCGGIFADTHKGYCKRRQRSK